jgi:hypothetical protein
MSISTAVAPDVVHFISTDVDALHSTVDGPTSEKLLIFTELLPLLPVVEPGGSEVVGAEFAVVGDEAGLDVVVDELSASVEEVSAVLLDVVVVGGVAFA